MDAPLPGRSYTRADVVGSGFAASLISSLQGPVEPAGSWGVGMTLLWSILSLGIVPAIWWPIRFSRLVKRERLLVARLSDWLRAHSSHSESAVLRNVDEDVTAAPILTILPLLICGGLVYFALSFHNQGHLSDVPALLSQTYWHRQFSLHDGLIHELIEDVRDHNWTLFTVWNVGLAAAYLCHGIQVRSHRSKMTRVLVRVNRVLRVEGLTPARIVPARPTSGVPWLLGIGCLWYMSAPWGIFAMLAGAGQYRYINRSAPALRTALSQSVIELSSRAGPSAEMTARCPRERCRAPVSPNAYFCGRCGGVLRS